MQIVTKPLQGILPGVFTFVIPNEPERMRRRERNPEDVAGNNAATGNSLEKNGLYRGTALQTRKQCVYPLPF
jgi:hypothetical protein